MARQLLARKYKFVKRENRAVENHLKKIRQDTAYDSRLSAMQLDVLRDLKRINSHLTQVAYPILAAAGQLRKRLRPEKHGERDESRVSVPAKPSPNT